MALGTSYSVHVPTPAGMPGCTQNANTHAPRHHHTHCALAISHGIRAHTHTQMYSHVCTYTLPRAFTHRHMECARDQEEVEHCQQ